jgi:malate/lactate dehydrogenase
VGRRGNRLTWRQVRSRRLRRGLLARRTPNDRLVEAVREVGGIQAQLTAAAEIAIAARVSRVTRAQVRDELWQRRLVTSATADSNAEETTCAARHLGIPVFSSAKERT